MNREKVNSVKTTLNVLTTNVEEFRLKQDAVKSVSETIKLGKSSVAIDEKLWAS